MPANKRRPFFHVGRNQRIGRRLARPPVAQQQGEAGTDGQERRRRRDQEDEAELAVSPELRCLLDRIKGAETMRKGLVHAVMEKLERGELVTSETVREAAEKILREGP